jgi:hypothetical protein
MNLIVNQAPEGIQENVLHMEEETDAVILIVK